MKKTMFLMFICIGIIFLNTSAYSKNIYLSANQAEKIRNVIALDPGQTNTDGVTLVSNIQSEDSGQIVYYISNKKIKKLSIYGNPMQGTINITIYKVDLENGNILDADGKLMTDDLFNPLNVNFENNQDELVVNFSSNYSKNKNEVWVIDFDIRPGDTNPEIYGIKVKV